MARPTATATVAIDGVVYKTIKPEIADYLLERLAGKSHNVASRHLEHATVVVPLFTLSATATPEELATALRLTLIHTPPKGEE